jgi:tetratricopeptide (TPR) repeat protein
MALLIPNYRERDVPPLFAGVVRDDLIEHDFNRVLQEALTELSGDHFVASLGKFREARTLSRGQEPLERKVQECALSEAAKLVEGNWRVAETLLVEVAQAPDAFRAEIENQRREEIIQVALDESGRAEHTEYLPHSRERLAGLLRTYPGDARLESRLQVLDALLAERNAAERDKNLCRLALFRDRLNAANKPETLRRFRTLAAPFADPYGDDPHFAAILDDAASLLSSYENACALLAEGRHRESLQICGQVLERKPANNLFRLLEEKAKAREWVSLLASSTMQRAQSFAQEGQYAEALEELESLRSIDPAYPGLDSETLHCAALKERSQALGAPTPAPPPEIVEEETIAQQPIFDPLPSFVPRPASTLFPLGRKIAITEEAWNHLKTGLAATFALLLVVLLLASNFRR